MLKSLQEVEQFLSHFKAKMKIFGTLFTDKNKNKEALQILGINNNIRIKVVEYIETTDYIETLSDELSFGECGCLAKMHSAKNYILRFRWVIPTQIQYVFHSILQIILKIMYTKMERIVDMKSPFTGGQVKEIITSEEMVFRGEKYPEIPVRYYVCMDSGEEFTDGEQDNEWTSALYVQYREQYGIPSPEEIKATRERHGLNVSQLTRILGFGKNQIAWYEDGQLPSLTNGRLLSLIQDPKIMEKCVRLSAISEEEKKKTIGKIHQSAT